MYTTIRKRDGRLARFDSSKIAAALEKAGTATDEFGEGVSKLLTRQVVKLLPKAIRYKVPNVEEVQNVVEQVLLASPYQKTAKAYILYREQHAQLRTLSQTHRVELMDQYLQNLDWQVSENSNMAYSLQGLNNYVSSEISKTYWLHKVYPPEVCQPAENGDLHIHDLNTLSTYCVGWDLQDLLRVGFKGTQDKIESKPAKHFKVVLGQIVNFFYTLQGESAGAQAFSSFDTLLAPFIRYDKLTQEEVEQALQEFVFNMNVPTRVGFQTPFTNVTLDLIAPSTLTREAVLIGGEPMKETYGEFQKEMDMFNAAFTKVIAEGDAKGRVFTFPIPTYNISKDFDWDNPKLEGLWKMTAKYGIPYFSNFVNSDMDPEDARSMCCRLRLDNRELRKRGGGLFGANPLTGSIGVVTINLPRIGYLAKSQKEFLNRLGDLMDVAKESLEIKRKLLEKLTDAGLYPYSKFYLRDIKAHNGTYWTNHFSTIGLVGMNEACLNLLREDVGSVKGRKFATKVLDFMRNRIQNYQKETDNYYNLEATPAEATAFRFASKDKELYPDIAVANEAEHLLGQPPFYTNSSHLPVNFTDDMFELLDLQDDLQTKYTGGTVVHLFIGEEISDTSAVKALVRTICTKYHLPYFTLTPTFSVCPEHGYVAGKVPVCETCGAENNVYSRIVGYLRPVKQWNPGKKAEFSARSTYRMPGTVPASRPSKQTREKVGA
ncbi:MAG: ribonucleoside triphosphate reductase [bacterium]